MAGPANGRGPVPSVNRFADFRAGPREASSARAMKHSAAVLLAVLAFFTAEVRGIEPAPLIEPDADCLRFDEIGLYAVGCRYRNEQEKWFPIGWSHGFDTLTGVALESAGEQNRRPAWLLHPPWRGGTGVSFQEFRLQLPPAAAVRCIQLTGATSMRRDALAGPGEGTKSDGVTFRIRANGRLLLDTHRADSQWGPFPSISPGWRVRR